MSTPAVWKDRLEGKNTYQAAQAIISRLVGYRPTSLKRADDTTNLTFAIDALIELAKEGKVPK